MNFRFFCFSGIVSMIAALAPVTNLKFGVSQAYNNAACESYTYFKISVVDPCKDLVITLVCTKGLGDMFVRKSAYVPVYPTSDMLTWRSQSPTPKKNVMTISHWEPAFSVGDFYIGVYADCEDENSPLSFTITATEGVDDSGDIFKYPALGLNKIIKQQGHTYFRFCVPYDCNTVKINYNTGSVLVADPTDDTVQPFTKSMSVAPTIIMSRRQPKANIQNNVFRAWGTSIVTKPTDPTARDDNGFLSGAYYVGVYGWCTPGPYCTDEKTCFHCQDYGNGAPLNVSVEVKQLEGGSCSAVTYLREDPETTAIESGVLYSGSIKCNGNRYFKIAVPDPCYNLNVISTNPGASTSSQSGDLYIGKWPTTHPFQQERGWSHFFWGGKNFTISAFDPTFSGGYTCGMDGKGLCVYYIQINAWCDNSTTPRNFKLNFTVKATLERAHAIFGTPQTQQKLTSDKAVNTYQFCIPEASNVVAKLSSFQDSCPLSTRYNHYTMIISPNLQNPPENTLVWRTEEHENSVIALSTSLPNYRTGQFYLSVIGRCNASASAAACKANSCNCGSCASLANAYSLTVDRASSFPAPTLPTQAPTGGTIFSITQLPALNAGQIAGIVIGLIIENLVLIGLMVCIMRAIGGNSKKKYGAEESRAGEAMEGLSPLAERNDNTASSPYRSA